MGVRHQTREPASVPPVNGVVLAHDYVTQRGGAERVALRIAEAFPGAPMYTTLYEPEDTFPEFRDIDLRTGRLNRFGLLRRHHRLALPMLASAVDSQRISGRLMIASSTGWAHGYQGADYNIVYCHAPARWLYQTERYLGSHRNPGLRGRLRQRASEVVLARQAQALRDWDVRSARRADLYLVNSTLTQQAVEQAYGIEAEVLPPPPALGPSEAERAVEEVEPGYLLCVARLLPYKNVDAIIAAVNSLSDTRLVVVGSGPDRERLLGLAGPRVQLLGRVEDDQLRWLYRNAEALVAASYEDYGLAPLEAGSFGRPSIVLRYGGFLDTVVEGRTGIFFDSPSAPDIAEGIRVAKQCSWSEKTIMNHVARFSSGPFVKRLQDLAARVTGTTAALQEPAPPPVAAAS
jgi:glycosyltransferase involved in cell wall biosynthesis